MEALNYKISCVMTTYRRFTCVERSISMFLNQDYTGETELIILNTDDKYPLVLGSELINDHRIKIINNNIDYATGNKYDNIGSIRRDALSHATGTHYICWDDDDIFLPWNIRQCVDGLNKYPDMWAWKPEYSMFWRSDGLLEIAGNAMEASIISSIEKIKEIGFRPHKGGGEHLSWLEQLQKNRKIFFDKDSIPGYCFNWSDQGIIRGHKQSGTIDHPDNFNLHKEHTKDYATRALVPFDSNTLSEIYSKFGNFLKDSVGEVSKPGYIITEEKYNKYVAPNVS